jgi:hypothetical protein
MIHFYKEKVEMPKKQRGGTCGAICPMQGGHSRDHVGVMSISRKRGVGLRSVRSVPTGGYSRDHVGVMSISRERGVGLRKAGPQGLRALGSVRSVPTGGYRPTARNRSFLKRYKQGKSIGFTMRASLKAKGLIPRANGTKRVSAKYRGNM